MDEVSRAIHWRFRDISRQRKLPTCFTKSGACRQRRSGSEQGDVRHAEFVEHRPIERSGASGLSQKRSGRGGTGSRSHFNYSRILLFFILTRKLVGHWRQRIGRWGGSGSVLKRFWFGFLLGKIPTVVVFPIVINIVIIVIMRQPNYINSALLIALT